MEQSKALDVDSSFILHPSSFVRTARSAEDRDLEFLLKARRATWYGAEEYDEVEERLQVRIAIARGDRWFVLERQERSESKSDGSPLLHPTPYALLPAPVMALKVEPYGPLLAVETVYREGQAQPGGLRADLRALVGYAAGRYRRHTRWVYLTVHTGNPRMAKLLRLYQTMFGFEVEALRLCAPIEAVETGCRAGAPSPAE